MESTDVEVLRKVLTLPIPSILKLFLPPMVDVKGKTFVFQRLSKIPSFSTQIDDHEQASRNSFQRQSAFS